MSLPAPSRMQGAGPEPERPGTWPLRRRLVLLGALLVAFIVWYMSVARIAGPGAAAPAGFVVLAAGYLLGLPAGATAGILIMPLIWSLYGPAGVPAELPSLRSGAFYVLVMTGMGAGGGWVGRMQARTEQARRDATRSAEEAALAQQAAGLGYWSLHRDGRIEWSQELVDIFGFEEPPADMAIIYGRLHPDDRAVAQTNIERLWQEGGHVEGDQRAVWPDGTVRWLHYTATTEPSDDGDVVRIYGTAQDITARKRDQAAGERFRDLLDRLEDVYWVGDPANDVFQFSGAAEAMFGRPVQDLSVDPSTLQETVHPDDLPKTMAAIGQAVAGKAATVEFRTVHPDGSTRWIRSRAWPIPDDPTYTACGIMTDVTAQHEVGRLQELDRAKALFMNAAAHELNTPLTPLKLQATILERKYPEEKAIGILQRNVERMQVLVQDLLDAARVQAGRLKHDMQDDLDLSAILKDVAAGAELQAQQNDKDWEAEIQESLTVRGDPVRLTQVFSNLTNNALKFTPLRGSVRLQAWQDNGTVHAQITDTGLGLTSSQMVGLFEPFQQFHQRHTGTHRGTGLGLFISRGIVEQHQGRIEVDSEGPGKGSTFTVILPEHSTAKSVESGALTEEE